MSERLERVTAFSELRVGLIVVGKPCHACGSAHRFMVVGDETFNGLPARSVLPQPRCNGPFTQMVVAQSDVAAGKVFRVVDGLEEPSTETAAASGTTRRTPQKERANG